ncbi:ABC transporter permease [Nocardioides bizhenqiangii]|uniref:ABC transporter permease n=1 Tax=Nocardioides bizhenqiangii TaxID=3095076 RepID=A0ABZ0ZPQ7_9ACTN|nr:MULTISPECIES: ABC transporter permease [unclassified Nocardioides]MDZ5619659.1 ABC transporter permease [Nocardioides sp. HM23]WQQ26330.1 ABC transporter permease [Nocardioides sp. HM61]
MAHVVPTDAPEGAPPPDQGRRRGLAGYALLTPGSLWLALFFVVPTVSLVATSLYDPTGSLELGYKMTGYVQNYPDAISAYWPQIQRSLTYALIATVACIVLGYPLAYAIAFKAGRFKTVLLVAVIAPFFTSFLVRTLAWQYLLGDNEFVVTFLRWLPFTGADLQLINTPFAVVAGLTYNFLPFFVLPLYASLEKIDHRLLEAAGDLYASPFRGFLKVTLPLSMPGLVAGTLLTFIPAAGDYINDELLGSPKTRMVGNEIQGLFYAGDYPTASALSVAMMVTIVVLVAIYVWRAGTDELV